MKFLTPPTDNLYKFVAVFGLILIGLSFFVSDLYISEKHEINKDYSNLIVDLENTDKEIKIVKTQYDSLENKIIELEQIERYDSIHKIKPLHYYFVDRILKLNEQSSKQIIEGKKLIKLDDYNAKKKEHYGLFSNFLLKIGILLIIIGFLCWYFKYQRYIDAETKWKGEVYFKLLNDEIEKKRIIKEIVDNNSIDNSDANNQTKE